ncbi:MAG: hypothetical protein IJ242_04670 [Clostridia bacterium]|nr:hypothetical protein [Clostridia bacterium]
MAENRHRFQLYMIKPGTYAGLSKQIFAIDTVPEAGRCQRDALAQALVCQIMASAIDTVPKA